MKILRERGPGEENELLVLPVVVLISLPILISLQKFCSQGGLCSGELPWSSCHKLAHEIPFPYVHRELSAWFVFLLELYAKASALVFPGENHQHNLVRSS